MTTPILTKRRWQCLVALRNSPALLDRPFMARELIIPYRRNNGAAAGATMDSLRAAGWIERADMATTWGPGAAFRMGKTPQAWVVTEAGREAIKQCPDVFPGEPRY